MYKYTCTNCGDIKYGDCTLNETHHAKCGSAAFGLWKKVWLDIKEYNRLIEQGIINKENMGNVNR